MTTLMPLKRAVVEITNEAISNDGESIKRAIRSWHNRLAFGSIPRFLVTKLGRELFLDIEAFENWLDEKDNQNGHSRPGRPRTKDV